MINCDMGSRRFRIPSTSALVAFESVARLKSVGVAAAELNTSQSAISRHLKRLEETLGAPLFGKAGRGIALTPAGARYFAAVTPALEAIQSAGQMLRLSERDVTIACTHEVSHLVLMPRFAGLKKALGAGVHVRILTCEYDMVPAMVHAGADITFEYSEEQPGEQSAIVVPEEIVPVAAPGFFDAHAPILRRPPADWHAVPLLALSKDNLGWATWENWFAAAGSPAPAAPSETFENYVYLLEAATAGAGLALGWKGFVDRYLEAGTLVQTADSWLSCPANLLARLTNKGTRNGAAARCMAFLARLNATA